MITLPEAEALFEELRAGFANLSRQIKRISETRAWEVLGYSSFAAAWRAYMADVPVRTDLERALLTYELAESGLSADEIAAEIPDLGPVTVARLLEKKAMGVPAEGVSVPKAREAEREGQTGEDQVWRKGHPVTRPSAPRRIHLDLGEERYQQVSRAAAAVGLTVRELLDEALRAHLELLSRGERVTT